MAHSDSIDQVSRPGNTQRTAQPAKVVEIVAREMVQAICENICARGRHGTGILMAVDVKKKERHCDFEQMVNWGFRCGNGDTDAWVQDVHKQRVSNT
jgi:glutamine synthetase type III